MLVDDVVNRYDHIGVTEAEAQALLSTGETRLQRYSTNTTNNATHERWYFDYITGDAVSSEMQSLMDDYGIETAGDYFSERIQRTAKRRAKKKARASLVAQVIVTAVVMIATGPGGLLAVGGNFGLVSASTAISVGAGGMAGAAASGGDLGDYSRGWHWWSTRRRFSWCIFSRRCRS